MTDSLKNNRFIEACFGRATTARPIWIMRQAGRYMKEYRDIRSKVSFLELCKNPDLVCEVTTFAANKLQVDAAIIFADILLITEAMGFNLSFGKGHGPQIINPFREANDLARIHTQDISQQCSYLKRGIQLTQKELNQEIPLIGFAGAPFTVAAYMIEGGGSKNFEHIKSMMYRSPDVLKSFLTKVTDATIQYVDMQVDAGINAFQLFDSWIGCLDAPHAQAFALPFAKKIFNHLGTHYPNIPSIYFGVNTQHLLPLMNTAGAQVLGIDFHSNLAEQWHQTGATAVQGNLDPCVLLSDRDTIKREAESILASVEKKPGYIFNLGHGILPSTPVEHAQYLVDLVHEFRAN